MCGVDQSVKMKSFPFIFLFVASVCQISCERRNPLSIAFVNVTNHLFRLETRMFVNNYGVDQNTMTWLLLKSMNQREMPFMLQNLEISNKKIYLDSSALVTFSSFEKLRNFNTKLILNNEFYKPLQIFIYCEEANINDINSLALGASKTFRDRYNPVVRNGQHTYFNFRTDLEHIIQYEYFLVNEAKAIRLMTFLWYSPEMCKKLYLKEVNRFNKQTKKWQSDKFLFEKLKDFHNCEIKILSDISEKSEFHEVISNELSDHLNYQPKTAKGLKKEDLLVDAIVRKGCYDAHFKKVER